MSITSGSQRVKKKSCKALTWLSLIKCGPCIKGFIERVGCKVWPRSLREIGKLDQTQIVIYRHNEKKKQSNDQTILSYIINKKLIT